MWQADGRGSKGQLRIYGMIRALYPRYTVLWEQEIKSLRQRFDIFIKELGVAFEIDGSQHYKVNSFFHRDLMAPKRGFIADQRKDSFCFDNGIKMVRLNYDDALKMSESDLKERIDSIMYPETEYSFSCLG